jgi:hypothetical protein
MDFKDRLRKFQLTQLNQIEVASPGSADWEEMEGDAKVRFCSGCQLRVFNLSAMDVEEAAARVAEHANGLCVRFFRRAYGTLLTRDRPVGQERTQRRRRLAVRTSVEITVAAAICAVMGATAFSRTYATAGVVAPRQTGSMAKRFAIIDGDLERLRMLINTDHDPEATDRRGYTLLMSAAEVGFVDAVALLLRYGADPAARDAEGRSAMDVALQEKQWNVATMLRKARSNR